MTSEAQARRVIDDKLIAAGWLVQDLQHVNLGAAPGVAVREYPTDTGPADYALFVDRQAVGVIEAKRDEAGERITAAEAQTARYAHAGLKWKVAGNPLPFLFEATGQIIRFTDARDPRPRSRELFHFFRPAQLAVYHSRIAVTVDMIATGTDVKSLEVLLFMPASVLLERIRAERAGGTAGDTKCGRKAGSGMKMATRRVST